MGSRQCSPEDYARAFFCSEAVRRGQNSEVEQFLRSVQEEFLSIQFGDVHVSLDPAPGYGVKFLMADAGDAIFIAFQPTGIPEDRMSGSAFVRLPSGGSVDRGIFELSKCFLGPDLTILSELFRMSEKRLVFCGHGVGGAVAHIVVLHFWAAYYESGVKAHGHQNDMISIAFGAPCICSSKYAEKVNRNEGLNSRFFSFVHEDDPILHSREDRTRTDQVKQRRKNRQQQKFFPIGESSTHLKASDWSVPRYVPQVPIFKQWSFYDSYKSALLSEGKSPITANSPAGRKLALNVTTPAPVITSVKLKTMDSGRFIRIKGSNLLFLREPVRLGGLDPWETKMQTDTELYIASPPQTDVNRKGDDTEDALAFIVLKTAFGAASHLLFEDNMSDGQPTAARRLLSVFFFFGEQMKGRRLLSKKFLIFVVLATPPLGYLYHSTILAELDKLDGDEQCVGGVKPSTMKNIVERNENLQENIKIMNNVVKQVIEFLTRSFNIRYEEKFPVLVAGVSGSLALVTGLVLLPEWIFFAVSGVTFLLTASCVLLDFMLRLLQCISPE